MSISRETYKEAKTFRTQMLVMGILFLPVGGLGLIFLIMYFNLKGVMDKYDETNKIEKL